MLVKLLASYRAYEFNLEFILFNLAFLDIMTNIISIYPPSCVHLQKATVLQTCFIKKIQTFSSFTKCPQSTWIA